MIKDEVLQKSLKFFWRGQWVFILFSGVFGALFMVTTFGSFVASYWAIRHDLDRVVLLAALFFLAMVSYIAHWNFLGKGEIQFQLRNLRSILDKIMSRNFCKFVIAALMFFLIYSGTSYFLAPYRLGRDALIQYIIPLITFGFFLPMILFGTVFPAIVDNDHRFKFIESLRKSFMALRAIIVFSLVSFFLMLLWLVIVFLVTWFTFPSPSTYSGEISGGLGLGRLSEDPYLRLWSVLTGFFNVSLLCYFSVFIKIYAAAKLCSVYREIVPAPELGAE